MYHLKKRWGGADEAHILVRRYIFTENFLIVVVEMILFPGLFIFDVLKHKTSNKKNGSQKKCKFLLFLKRRKLLTFSADSALFRETYKLFSWITLSSVLEPNSIFSKVN